MYFGFKINYRNDNSHLGENRSAQFKNKQNQKTYQGCPSALFYVSTPMNIIHIFSMPK